MMDSYYLDLQVYIYFSGSPSRSRPNPPVIKQPLGPQAIGKIKQQHKVCMFIFIVCTCVDIKGGPVCYSISLLKNGFCVNAVCITQSTYIKCNKREMAIDNPYVEISNNL